VGRRDDIDAAKGRATGVIGMAARACNMAMATLGNRMLVAIWQWQSGNGTGWRFGARSRSPSAPAGISVGPLITVDRGDTTFAARSGFRFKVALVTSAGGNFGRPLITVDRGYLGGVRWGCP
jgi:hypothetical protein